MPTTLTPEQIDAHDKDKLRLAYHEAGHAVALAHEGAGDLIRRVSVEASYDSAGHISTFDIGDPQLEIIYKLAGFVAEIMLDDWDGAMDQEAGDWIDLIHIHAVLRGIATTDVDEAREIAEAIHDPDWVDESLGRSAEYAYDILNQDWEAVRAISVGIGVRHARGFLEQLVGDIVGVVASAHFDAVADPLADRILRMRHRPLLLARLA